MITILNTYPGSVLQDMTLMIFLIVLLVADISGMLHSLGDGWIEGALSFFLNFCLVMAVILVGVGVLNKETRVQYHEAIIPPQVTFMEVMDRYEVEERRGDLWILSEPKEVR